MTASKLGFITRQTAAQAPRTWSWQWQEYGVSRVLSSIFTAALVLNAVLRFDDGRAVAALVPDAHFVPLESRNHILLENKPAWSHFSSEFEQFLSTPEPSTSSQIDDLTSRERDVLEFVAQGLSNSEVSEQLAISEKTVRNHVSTILSKLGADSRAKAVALARDAGFGRRTRRRE
jgi:DNA-binding NarL/FixJ family response regulator